MRPRVWAPTRIGDGYAVSRIDCESQIGSGALPLETLPSAGLSITAVGKENAGRRLEALVAAVRALPVPVIGRVHEGAFILDLRCLDDAAAFGANLCALDLRTGGGGHA
jgi:L-seryl-tRNA(Ser) seleniumtransferase